MRELKFNLKYLLTKKEFCLATFILFFINIIHVFLTIQYSNSLNLTIENNYSAAYQMILCNVQVVFNVLLVLIFPIVSAMMISDTSFYEKEKRIDSILFTRLNYKKNLLVKFFLSFLVSFFVCFSSFYLNYFLMKNLFMNGQGLSYFQSVSFYGVIDSLDFIDGMRFQNLELYVFLRVVVTSMTIALLSMFSYSISFYLKKRILIYLVPFAVILIGMYLFPLFHFSHNGYASFLQSLTNYTFQDVFLAFGILIFLSICFFFPHYKKKETIFS